MEANFSELKSIWMNLFDEKLVSEAIKSEDEVIKNVIMLYTTLKVQFNKIDQNLSNQLELMKLRLKEDKVVNRMNILESNIKKSKENFESGRLSPILRKQTAKSKKTGVISKKIRDENFQPTELKDFDDWKIKAAIPLSSKKVGAISKTIKDVKSSEVKDMNDFDIAEARPLSSRVIETTSNKIKGVKSSEVKDMDDFDIMEVSPHSCRVIETTSNKIKGVKSSNVKNMDDFDVIEASPLSSRVIETTSNKIKGVKPSKVKDMDDFDIAEARPLSSRIIETTSNKVKDVKSIDVKSMDNFNILKATPVSSRKIGAFSKKFKDVKSPDAEDVDDFDIVEATPVLNKKQKFCSSIRAFSSPQKKVDETMPSMLSINEILNRVSVSSPKNSTGVHNENISKKLDFAPKTLKDKEEDDLIGWSCCSCQEFYPTLSLPRSIIKNKMKECFLKHRKSKTLEETIDGFWDLTMPATPPEHKNLEDDTDCSMVFDLNE